MNIIFLEAVQAHGGARKSTIELAKRLKDYGHKSMIVDFWGTCSDFIEDVNLAEVPIHILIKRERPIAIFNSQNPLVIVKNIFDFILNWFNLRKELNKVAKKFGADVIVVNNIKTNSILKKGATYKIAYFARGWFAFNSLGKLKKLLFKYNADYFIGVSQATRQAIYTGGLAPMEKIFVVPNAIDTVKVDEFKKNGRNINDNSIVILHCGGFLPTKGQQLSLALAKKLKDNNVQFKMILMGSVYDSSISSNFLKKVENIIKDLEISDRVEIVLNHKNPYEVFKDSHILIHPSDTEGLPRVIMEALAFGMPVIANPVGGVTDFILDNFTGYITNHNDLNDYYSAVMRLYNNPEIYKEISSNGRELIEANYLPNLQVEMFNNVLLKVNNI